MGFLHFTSDVYATAFRSRGRSAATLSIKGPNYTMENRMNKILPTILAVLLGAGICFAQTAAAQSPGQTAPAQAPQQASGQPAPPPADDKDKKEDMAAGRKRVAAVRRAAWLKLEQDTLPAVDQLGQTSPCGNEKLIAKKIEAVRAAAKEYTAAYHTYLQTWSEYNLKDIEESKKYWADMAARQHDISDTINSQEDELKEFQRKRANVAADDDKMREILDEIINKATSRLEELRSGKGFADSNEKNRQLSEEYWNMKTESIKKDEQLVDAIQKNYESRYDGIIQQWHTECTSRTKPSPMDDLPLLKKK